MTICLRERPEPQLDTIPEFGNFVMVSGKVIAIIEEFNYSITREMAPVYAFGSVNAVSFSRGKQGIAGHIRFLEIYKPIPNIFDIELRTTTNSTRFDGVELIEEGSSIDMSTIITHKLYTFVARNIKNILTLS